MTDLVIFSRDRAMQLQATLESTEHYYPFDNIYVIYYGSTPAYREGYAKVEGAKMLNCLPEHGKFWLDRTLKDSKARWVAFMCDDNVMYSTPNVPHTEAVWDKLFCYCLRFGSNTRGFPLHSEKFGLLYWLWNIEGKHFNYPFALDGHIYERELVAPIIERVSWQTPNKLEAEMQNYKGEYPPLMGCPQQSTLMSYSVNRVSAESGCATSNSHPPDELNQRWLDGERIAWDEMDYNCDRPIYEDYELIFR